MAKGFLDGYKTYDTSGGFGSPKKWQHAFRQRMSEEEASAIISGATQTPQAILGVPDNATGTVIKKAFRALMLQWHPDRNQHRQEEAETETKKIIAAYTLLMKGR